MSELAVRFGVLTLVRRVEPANGKARYVCRCDCGVEVERRLDDLKTRVKNGQKPSCGCLFHNERSRLSMLAFDPSKYMARRFGRLIVTGVDVDTTRPKAKNRLVCLCDCGAQSVVRPDSLLRGVARSCGCIQREHASALGHLELRHGKTVFGKLRGGMTPVYQCWSSIIKNVHVGLTKRTYNTVLHEYDPRWKLFDEFYADFGDLELSQTIKRLDNQLPWCKENCVITSGYRDVARYEGVA